MISKEINKVQNEVKKSNEKTLTGAVKAWCNLFKSGKEINDILKENDIKVSKEVVPALVALAKNKKLKMSEIEDIAILGSSHKRFGYNEPIEYDFGIYYETFNGADKRIIKCAVPIKRYTFNLIAKCVTYYLTHPKNER